MPLETLSPGVMSIGVQVNPLNVRYRCEVGINSELNKITNISQSQDTRLTQHEHAMLAAVSFNHSPAGASSMSAADMN